MLRDLFEEKPELKKMILYVLLGIVLIIVSIIIFSLFKTEKLSYEKLENKMKEAAISYGEDNKDKLPSEGNSITVSYDTLVQSKQIKAINKYTNNSCSGNVVIRNTNNLYSYTPYLDCGNDYKTTTFYTKILNDNEIVSEKSGLYVQGDTKVFRGEDIKNFVKIDDYMWQVIKIDNDNSIKLILYNGKMRTKFDDRYNSERGYSIGKNDYKVSRLREKVEELYNSSSFLSDDIKSKLVSKPICIGSRSEEQNINDGSVECSKILEGEYIGYLSLYEYINASLDTKCLNTNTDECQNYNYLSNTQNNVSWWLITPNNKNTYQAYYISSVGSINNANCSLALYARPTIYLNTDTIYSSGSGTYDDPYIIK